MLNLLVLILLFAGMQFVMFFVFYRMVLRELPGQINDLLFNRHLENEFTTISRDVADLLRTKLLQLEEERFEVAARYAVVKGKRKLSTTEKNERDGLRKSVEQLSKQIAATRTNLSETYSADVLGHLRRFEQARLVAALNRYLDERSTGSGSRSRGRVR